MNKVSYYISTILILGIQALALANPKPMAPAQTGYQECAGYAEFADLSVGNRDLALANGILDGALDRSMQDIDQPMLPSEVQKRDSCVLLALQNGANPNGTADSVVAPLIQAISNNDLTEVQALLSFKANPNVKDELMGKENAPSALHRACDSAQQEISLALLQAGADPVVGEPLWDAAASAQDQVVAAMLKTGKIPVSQITDFGSDKSISQTALDASEMRLDALNLYVKQFKADDKVSYKIDYVNENILYAYYVHMKNLKNGDSPDAFVSDLLAKQSKISGLLKSAGWTCQQENCGISNDDNDTSDSSTTDTAAADTPN